MVSPRPKVIAVTVLTSLDANALEDVGQGDDPQLQAHRLSLMAQASGLDGVVCSPHEAGVIRIACPRPFLIVTPGVRPAGAALADQKRVTTPAEALAEGADILVIGRPITAAPDPAAAARTIAEGLGTLTGGSPGT
jgi:orotidine-5'-phosphate decarboxylase